MRLEQPSLPSAFAPAIMFKKAAVERFDAVFALHEACRSCTDPEALEAVVAANAKDIELPDWEFRTALHVCAVHGNDVAAEVLPLPLPPPASSGSMRLPLCTLQRSTLRAQQIAQTPSTGLTCRGQHARHGER